jgi:hypothetical protein
MRPGNHKQTTYTTTTPALNKIQGREGSYERHTTKDDLDDVGRQVGAGTLEESITIVVCLKKSVTSMDTNHSAHSKSFGHSAAE